MIKVIHDIANTMFRDPAGAQRAGSPILLQLLVSGDLAGTASAGRPEDASMDCPGAASCGAGACPLLHVRFDKDGSEQVLPMECAGRRGDYLGYRITFTPPEKGLWWYWFELPEGQHLVGRDAQTGQAALTDEPQCWQITAYEPSYEDPDWIFGGVFYHVFVDRFAKAGDPVYMDGKITRDDWGGMPVWQPNEEGEILNNDFFGGNLEGIRTKLPYLSELGVTCLYLSPIFEAYSNHKYDTTDYMKVDPMFGDEEGFRRLCEDARDLGIRVICDGVFSHTGADSRYFDILDRFGGGACHHQDSPYRDWYYFEDDGWQSWWGIKTLPRVNKNVPSYQEFMTGENGVIRHWLRAGASGWRLDVVDELPQQFMERLTASIKAEKPDALVLGEVWEDASNKVAYDERKNYFEGDKLDSVMNYPLRRGIIEYVREGDAAALARPMETIMENYPPRVIHALMNILGTHDTERILTALAGQKLGPGAGRKEKASIHMDKDQWAAGIRLLKIAVCLQMTLPGVPCIYYGDEAGMEGYNDPFNRRCFPWGHENAELQDWYRRVIAVRHSCDTYRDGNYRLLAARDGMFAFERASCAGAAGISDGGALQGFEDRRITVTNCGQKPQILPLLGSWHDLLSDAAFTDDVMVLPGQAMILAPVRTV